MMNKSTTLAFAAATTLTASLFAVPLAQAAPKTLDYVPVPNRAALTKGDLNKSGVDKSVRLVDDYGDYPNTVASIGQYCETSDNGATGFEPRPVGGRSWTFSDKNWTTTVQETVTVWNDVTGAFADVVNDTGFCRYGAIGWTGYTQEVLPDGTFVASWYENTVATRVVDNALVSISVSAPDASIDTAVTLLDQAAKKVDRINL